MALGHNLQFIKFAFYFAALQVAVNGSQRLVRDVHPSFTCGPQGIKHYTNANETLEPKVDITCPNLPVKMDAHTEIVCEVLSSTFAKITWFYNGQPISDQSKSHVTVDWKTCNQTLKIKFTKTNDRGKYTCQVANTVGPVNKTCALDVKADKTKDIRIEYLKIVGNRQKALLQGTVELKCNMLHVESASWLRNGRVLRWSERHVWRREPTFGKHGKMFYLRIINVTKNDEGFYMCLGYKNGRKANKTFYLMTEPCPSGYFCSYEGNTAFPCPTTTYTRARVNKSVSEEMKKCFKKGSKRLVRDMRPYFTCGPQGIKHYTNANETLEPNVHITCPNLPVKLDAHAEIVCEVLSSTFAKITWFYNGQPISDQSKSHVTVDWKTCNQTLKIRFAKTSDRGKYTCQVANTVGTVNKTCALDVKADKTKDIHVEYLKIAGNRQKALLQGTVELKCNMLHVEDAVWLRNGTVIDYGSERHVRRWDHTFGKRGKMFYLRIINVTTNDEGLYMCRGYKSGRTANKTFYLKTEPCPSGYFCLYEGNTAFPCPTATYTRARVNKSVSEEMKQCIKKGGSVPAATRSRGSSSRNQDFMLIFMYTLMTLHGYLVCIR